MFLYSGPAWLPVEIFVGRSGRVEILVGLALSNDRNRYISISVINLL